MTEPRRVPVSTSGGDYDVLVGAGLLGELGERAQAALAKKPSRVLVVADTGLPAEQVNRATDSLRAAFGEVRTHPFTPSERAKSLDKLGDMLGVLLETRHERRDLVVALGGGITGDLAGFAAAIYRRGCALIQCPTTLLSMVDASVGGKTAANLVAADGRLVKNMVGSFYQPALVVADTATLGSLTDRDARCGLAECVKHGLLAGTASVGSPDAGLLGWIETHAADLAARSPGLADELVARNVAVKASVVATDEREAAASKAGGRALLNLGHTFAHAIEPMPSLSPTGQAADAPLRHGEAVALGLVCACAAGESLGITRSGTTDRIRGLLGTLGLPTSVRGLPANAEIRSAMADDKKADAGSLRLVIPDGAGSCSVVESPSEAAVEAGIDAIRAGA